MKRAFATALAIALMFWACSKSSSPSTPTPTLQTVAVTGTASLANRNQTSQLTLTAVMSDGSSQNVTASATWASGSAAVASISTGGLVTALTNGTTTITATYQGKSSTLVVTVAMKATPVMTTFFSRLCTPSRAGMDVTMTESSGNIGMTVTSISITMTDVSHVQRYSHTFSAAEIIALLGTNHVNAGESRVFSMNTTYPGGVDTGDSTASVQMTVTDDAGNVSSLSQPSISQHDRC